MDFSLVLLCPFPDAEHPVTLCTAFGIVEQCSAARLSSHTQKLSWHQNYSIYGKKENVELILPANYCVTIS